MHPFHPFFFNLKTKQTCFQNTENSVDQVCTVITNLTSGREV
jgi:hypothetical protein